MSFWIGAAVCSLKLPFAESLKDRRHVVRSLIDGVRSRFSISPADLGPDGVWHHAELGFTAAGSSRAEIVTRMENLKNFLSQREDGGEFEITDYTQEVLDYADISDQQD